MQMQLLIFQLKYILDYVKVYKFKYILKTFNFYQCLRDIPSVPK